MIYLIIPVFLLYLLWLFCVHMDEKESSRRQTEVLPKKELQERSEPEQNKHDKGILSVRDFYYRFRRNDEEEELEQNLEKKRKPEEPPHDHQEDQQQEPSPVLRERRRPVVRTREGEEENEEEQPTDAEFSSAPDALPDSNKPIWVENGTQEEWRHDEDVVDTLIIKKDAETQTTVFQENKSIEARPPMRDEEMQNSPVKESLTTQTLLSTEEKGVGEPLETTNKEVQMSPEQEDQSLQESPERHSIGLGSPDASMRDESLQAVKEAEDRGIQKSISHHSMGIGSHRSYISQEMQAKPDNIDESLQREISKQSIGLRPRSFSLGNESVQSEKIEFLNPKPFVGIRKGNQYIFFDPKDKLDYLPLEKSILLDDEEEKLQSFKMPKFNLDDIPLEESTHLIQPKSPRLNLNLWDNELVESLHLQAQHQPLNLWDKDSVESILIPSPRLLQENVQEEDAWSLRSSQVSAHSVHTVRSLRSEELEELMK